MWSRVFIVLLMAASAVASAPAQSPEAKRSFRAHAEERMQILRSSRDARERAGAAEYLGGFEDPDVIAALESTLRDSDPRVRAAAASALWKTGKTAASARPSLVDALDDPEVSVVIRAAGALQALGMPEAQLVTARRRVLDAPAAAPADRFMAARGLVGHTPPSTLLDPVLQFLERASIPHPTSSRSIDERESMQRAVDTLNRLVRTGDRSLIPLLLDAAHTARYSQAAILNALALYSPKPDAWTSVLVSSLDSRDRNVRYAALSLLGRETNERDVRTWAPRAGALLRDSDESVRSEALQSLGKAGALAASEIDSVLAVLADPDPAMRRRAAAAIGEMGEQTQPVNASAKRHVAERARGELSSLAERDPDGEVRSEAKAALTKLERTTGAVDRSRVAGAPATQASPGAAEGRAVAYLRERNMRVEPGAFFQALTTTDVSLVRAFLDAGMSATIPVAGTGPPLVVALQAGDACATAERPTKENTKALITLLLERGAQADRGDTNGLTPLMAAALRGCDRAVMNLLISRGAKVTTQNRAGLTAFELGLALGHDGLDELIRAGYRLPPEKTKVYEQAYAGMPASLALIRKASTR